MADKKWTPPSGYKKSGKPTMSKKYPKLTVEQARGTVNPETRKKRAAAEAKRQAATEGAGGGRARLTSSKLVEKNLPKASETKRTPMEGKGIGTSTRKTGRTPMEGKGIGRTGTKATGRTPMEGKGIGRTTPKTGASPMQGKGIGRTAPSPTGGPAASGRSPRPGSSKVDRQVPVGSRGEQPFKAGGPAYPRPNLRDRGTTSTRGAADVSQEAQGGRKTGRGLAPSAKPGMARPLGSPRLKSQRSAQRGETGDQSLAAQRRKKKLGPGKQIWK